MAARRISYISFLVIVAAIASVTPHSTRESRQTQQLLEQYLNVCNDDAVKETQQAPRQTEPDAINAVAQSLLGYPGEFSLKNAVRFTHFISDKREEIASKNLILLE